MKTFVACLLLSSSAVTFAEEAVQGFTFPPFAIEDIKVPAQPLPAHPDYEEMKAIPVEELRGIMASAGADQTVAAKELLERRDQKTILRLVYSLKQGNVAAERILTSGSSESLAAIPYLMEDVAHGSLDYYGIFHGGDAIFGEGRVRVAAVKLVASTLADSPKFTGETRKCLRAISINESLIQTLSAESRYLIQWWLLNEDTFEAGKWDDTRPLPQEITYPSPKDDTRLPYKEPMDEGTQPPYGSPAWELPEPFEAWAARIVDPKRRNLDFVALSWDGKKVIEHPAKSLDPKTKPEDRESRKTPAPRNPPERESRDDFARRNGVLWITLAAVLMVVSSIVRWMRRKSAAKDRAAT